MVTGEEKEKVGLLFQCGRKRRAWSGHSRGKLVTAKESIMDQRQWATGLRASLECIPSWVKLKCQMIPLLWRLDNANGLRGKCCSGSKFRSIAYVVHRYPLIWIFADEHVHRSYLFTFSERGRPRGRSPALESLTLTPSKTLALARPQ